MTTVLKSRPADGRTTGARRRSTRSADAGWIDGRSQGSEPLRLGEHGLDPARGRRDDQSWVQQKVTIAALRDKHLVGGRARPVAFRPRASARVATTRRASPSREHALAPRPELHGLELRAAADAEAARAVEADLPGADRARSAYLELDDSTSSRRRSAHRTGAQRSSICSEPRRDAAAAVPAALGRGRAVAGGAKTPYAATVALEAWFRSTAASPTTSTRRGRCGMPPLVWFVTQHAPGLLPALRGRDGADAALARHPVAGRGRLHQRQLRQGEPEWTVTDHDAHTWVEVWFRG